MLINAQSDEQQQTDVEPSVKEASISRGIVVCHQNGRIHDEKAENCDKIGRNEPKRDAEENLCGHDRVEKHSRLDFVIVGGVKKVDEGAEGKKCQHSATHHFPRGEQFKVRQAE